MVTGILRDGTKTIEFFDFHERFTTYGYESLDDMYRISHHLRPEQCMSCWQDAAGPRGRCGSCREWQEVVERLFGWTERGVAIWSAQHYLRTHFGRDVLDVGDADLFPPIMHAYHRRGGRRHGFEGE